MEILNRLLHRVRYLLINSMYKNVENILKCMETSFSFICVLKIFYVIPTLPRYYTFY